MQPLIEWTCDRCGEQITSADRGIVVWRRNQETRRPEDFLLVHKTFLGEPDPRRCDPGDSGGYGSSSDLVNFLGPDGLTYLLAFLSPGPLINDPLPAEEIPDLDAWVDLVRRTQLPHYEEARRRFGSEEVHHWFGAANQVAPYRVDDLQAIAEGHFGDLEGWPDDLA